MKKTIQYFSKEYLERCKGATPDQIIEFLENYRTLLSQTQKTPNNCEHKENCEQAPQVYRAPLGLVNLDSARQSQIEAAEGSGPNEQDHCWNSKASEEDRFGKVAASPNSPNLTERGIDPTSPNPDL